MVIGLLAAPDLSYKIAESLQRDLPRILERRDDGQAWQVCLDEEPSLTKEQSMSSLCREASQKREQNGWDVALCVTDVPLRDQTRPIVAAAVPSEHVGVVVVPALGPWRPRARAQEAAVRLIAETVEKTLEPESKSAHQLKRRSVGLLAPERRLTEGRSRGIRYVTPAGLGHLQLLAGMVRANRPWRALAGLSKAVVAAFATGAYALLTISIWSLSAELSILRLVILMMASMAALVAWLILSHGLWERASEARPRRDTALYNAATVVTLCLAVACGYAALFLLILVAAELVVESSAVKKQVTGPINLGFYLRLTWMAASMATVAGALGSGLEDIKEVRAAAYGHHQRGRE
jgi:hypothetical protein